jgi:hypothetical protein
MITKKLSRPCEKLNKVVAITREKIYTRWVKNEDTRVYEEITLPNKGTEIVKELWCTAEGEALWNSWSADERSDFLKGL